jgi:hypothetical protein
MVGTRAEAAKARGDPGDAVKIDGDEDVRERRRKATILYVVAVHRGLKLSFTGAAALLGLDEKTADSLREREGQIKSTPEDLYTENRDWISPLLRAIVDSDCGGSADEDEDPALVPKSQKAEKAAETGVACYANDKGYTYEEAAKDVVMDGTEQDRQRIGTRVRKLRSAPAGDGDDESGSKLGAGRLNRSGRKEGKVMKGPALYGQHGVTHEVYNSKTYTAAKSIDEQVKAGTKRWTAAEA